MGARKDLKGRHFGRLVAVEPAGKDKHGHMLWKCLCEKCGKTKVLNYTYLMSGKARDCGCGISQGHDLTGVEFGPLTIIKPVGLGKNNHRMWLVKCAMCHKTFVRPARYFTRTDRERPRCPYCGA